ncbi:ketoacyl-ACP synthase III [Elizabethkingia sp. HX WHF]|uniref:Beta-ketoacyl-[acyl-carrier-protein] synthase III n=1 Tax=Elizabethkingia bruuniana TaxID=1756149 RepID=A0A7T7ZZ59_9FLAO|nr:MULTISPECIES: ketoacyl-ACP synthase III [Elizabethkingia]ATL44376.1 ketoacyl-ACP synthase III [Elizabethkingia miricola]AQX86845.1 3-oxoacyl-ACP synthase [Elizabethkingia bruuniana]KGO08354.1 3-oxoacyl-ACP synthase [Elizabethkingia miricola]KUY26918.1 3-oxoacyl-ACP synthase [Elizabethkingia bruuniana]MCL1639445.1 ketoacyl-ACP synthase III [Elizabethkingia bruuniana]
MEATIESIGIYIPENKITNQYFEEIIETSDEWITSRTGIKTRYFSKENEYTSDLCIKAIENLEKEYKKGLTDIDFIIIATSTPDQQFPSVASKIQDRFNIPQAGCVDISAGCAGFVYGIIMAQGLIASGSYKKILVAGAETLSKICDFTDRTTCILFGDGAGAVIVEASEQKQLFSSTTITDGSYGKELYKSEGHASINGENVVNDGKIHQNGRTVFKWAVSTLPVEILRLLEKNKLSLQDITWMIPHSANIRILENVCEELGFPKEKCLQSVTDYGNTSAASIPIAWYNGIKDRKLQPGDLIVLAGFGSGLTFSGICLRNQIANKHLIQ